ncbi:asparaginyl-tRNA synthetase [Gymnopus androsaceus JB14]|uniref:Asparaginyl-tRNA synthetase n=1 Tax=Gymnopus androsaceus JB14 TaxID=1447944 RepID=A0A6A4HSV1_9AGAR|nr:asparaginyl-tRNA synthetase [Gymnopus androsaceus JB14]
MRPVSRLPQTIKQLLASGKATSFTTITGHIRSIRRQKQVTFALIDDGSCAEGLQAVLKNCSDSLTFGTAVRLNGKLIPSRGPGQDIELLVDSAEVVGPCDPSTYPLQAHSGNTTEFLRSNLHLRLRTQLMQQTMRLRADLKSAIESFLNASGFVYCHTPIITGIDAEGGGESFRVEEGKEFFGAPAHLTVSSQLHLEAFQAALGRVYTLSPCFRAERSMTGRHLAEFWMLEAEWTSSSLDELCGFVEDMLKHAIGDTLDHAWPRVTFHDAIKILEASQQSFAFPPHPSQPLQSEHEKYLAEVHFKGPVFVINYPKAMKPFYMRANDDGETVACFDLLVPRVGELIGGSVREEREDALRRNMLQAGLISEGDMAENAYSSYLSLRQHGSLPHMGFGMGFERLLVWIGAEKGLVETGSVREAVGMPRWKGRMGIRHNTQLDSTEWISLLKRLC